MTETNWTQKGRERGLVAVMGAEKRVPMRSLKPRRLSSAKFPIVEYLSEENLQLIEDNADILLEEIGIDFLDDPKRWPCGKKRVPMCRVLECIFPRVCAAPSFRPPRPVNIPSMPATQNAM